MDRQTALKLNKLNSEFYQKVAPYFDSSRQYNWEGWEREEFLSEFKSREPLAVLDLGCGNGRFLNTILNFEFKILNYRGIDSSVELSAKAEEIATSLRSSQMRIVFENRDLLLDKWEVGLENKFNVVVCFGVLHHIPSNEFRLEFFKRVRKVLKPGGVFIFTIWNFEGSERQKNKIVNLDIVSRQARYDIGELDPNDYLLSWNRGVEAIRYSHAYTESEVESLIQNSSFIIRNSYLSDGKEGDLNRYYIVEYL